MVGASAAPDHPRLHTVSPSAIGGQICREAPWQRREVGSPRVRRPDRRTNQAGCASRPKRPARCVPVARGGAAQRGHPARVAAASRSGRLLGRVGFPRTGERSHPDAAAHRRCLFPRRTRRCGDQRHQDRRPRHPRSSIRPMARTRCLGGPRPVSFPQARATVSVAGFGGAVRPRGGGCMAAAWCAYLRAPCHGAGGAVQGRDPKPARDHPRRAPPTAAWSWLFRQGLRDRPLLGLAGCWLQVVQGAHSRLGPLAASRQ